MAADSLHDLENGKRSEMSSESSEDEDYDDYDQIRVGPDYQADIPELLSHPENNHKQRPKSLKLWFPPNNISEVQLNDYILFSKHKYGYDTEQCLGLLYWNKYDLKKSFCDLPNFSPQLNWSIIDKSNFDLAFDKFGKDFEQINTMLPDKSLKSIICYYYSWKRNKTRAWTIKPVNKLEHFCADRIQNGSSDISEPDNMIHSDNQIIGHVHKKIKLDDIVYRNIVPTTSFIFSRWNNGGIFNDIQEKIKEMFTILTT